MQVCVYAHEHAMVLICMRSMQHPTLREKYYMCMCIYRCTHPAAHSYVALSTEANDPECPKNNQTQ